jgi:transposase
MSITDVLPAEAGLSVTAVTIAADLIGVAATTTGSTGICPVCGTPSDRVHSRYTRTIADLPFRDRRAVLRVTVRRFRCPNAGCERTVFCERVPGLAPAHARHTGPLTESHRAIGFVAGGEAGSRLSERLAMPPSADTVLRRVKSAPEPSGPPPRYVGVDDWAWRKGHRYGTILIDLERGRVIDILPGRDGVALKEWLRDHPGVQVISRDRWSAYAEAATAAAPQATQVADRWHLLKNLREAVERLLERQHGSVREALAALPHTVTPGTGPTSEETATPPPSPPVEPILTSPRQEVRQAKRGRRQERYDRARQMHADGHSVRRIARELGISREAVGRYVRQSHCPDWAGRQPLPSRLDRFRERIDARIAAGTANAAAIHRELTDQGCRVSYYAVRRYVRRRRTVPGVQPPATSPRCPIQPPSTRHLSYAWVRRPENRDADETVHVQALHRIEELRAPLALADQFVGMVRKRETRTLAQWLAEAERSPSLDLRRFATGVRRDEAAVTAAMTEPWSNGQVEGQVNRLKLIKRSMFGRAGFELLRARVRHVA